VVTDFGIARAVDAAGAEKLTQTGMAVGTPAYMSPEQAVGEQVDGRADVYSLGCVLYEMLVGQVPFTGPTPQAVMARHSIDAVPRPQIVRQTIPDELEDVILTALAKAPADRFRTASEFSEALADAAAEAIARPGVSRITVAAQRRPRRRGVPKAVVGAVAAVAVVALGLAGWQFFLGSPRGSASVAEGGLDPRRVAVLYFEDLSFDGELAHVADGLTEGLIEQLEQVRTLNVISRNGVAAFRGEGIARDSIARALEAGSLIQGSVEPVGDRLRVIARLVDGGSGADFDRASFELPADQLFAAQDSVAEEVSRILRQRLGEEIRVRERRASTINVEAWSLVQRGERLRKDAETLFDGSDPDAASVALDRADSVLALAEAADAQWLEPIVLRAEIARRRTSLAATPGEADQWADVGLGHAARALEADPDDPQALAVRGALRYASWNHGPDPAPEEARRLLNGAKEDLEAAVAADPTLASAHNYLSLALYFTGDFIGANLAALRAIEEDAYLQNADQIHYRIWSTAYDLENFSEANRWCLEGRRRFPTDRRFVRCQLWMHSTRGVEPDPDAAWRLLAELEELTPERLWPRWKREGQIFVAASLARAGLADSARSLLVASRADDEIDPERGLVPVEAFIRTILGDTDEALRLLQSYMVFNPHHRHEETEDIHWWWRGLADDPRYQALMRSSN
jgi:serine/threonine-protein kinase